MKSFYFLFFLFLLGGRLEAQEVKDSVPVGAKDTASIPLVPVVEQKDSVVKRAAVDSVPARAPIDSAWKEMIRARSGKSFRDLVYQHHPFFAFDAPAFAASSDIKQFKGKEALFYVLIALLLIFALLRMLFAKYLNDLFRLFFRRTLKQRQITEQLSQTPLPSLVLNSFFIISAGLYIGFVLQHFNLGNQLNFWLLCLYSSAALGAMYLVKFLTLKFTGWVLNLSAATDSYIFIVFIINKVIGIFLLPFLILLAFAQADLYQVALTISWCGLGCLFVYRFILSYASIHKQVRVKLFHFVIYLLAFEIVPLLLIYKLLLYFLF